MAAIMLSKIPPINIDLFFMIIQYVYMNHNQESSKVNTAYASNTVWPRTSEYIDRSLKFSNMYIVGGTQKLL